MELAAPENFRIRSKDDNSEPLGEWHNIITDGGMGDLIGCLVAADWNIKHFKKVKFHIWVPDYLFLFARHVLPKGTKVGSFSQWKEEGWQNVPGMTTEWMTNHTCMRTHPVDYGFHMLSDRHIYDLNQKNYLQIKAEKIDVSEFDIPKKYLAICATGVEPIRTMPVETANAIIDDAISRDLIPVFLGKEKSDVGFGTFEIKAKPMEINLDKGINLINKTTLLQTAKIINDSEVFVTMDGGLLHLAGCTDASIVCGFTASDPIHVAPIRKGSQSYKFKAVEPEANLLNRYFQTYGSFKKGNFQKFEGWEDLKASMTPEKFIKKINQTLIDNEISNGRIAQNF